MGQYDDIHPERLGEDLHRLAQLILHLEDKGKLLDATPLLLRLLGDLRAKLFAYEVRFTGRLLPEKGEPPHILEAQRIVDEAIQRAREAAKEWSRPWNPDGGME